MMITKEIVGKRGTFIAPGTKDVAYVCIARPGAHPEISARTGVLVAAFPGSVDEFISINEPNSPPFLSQRMKNRVRRCPCGKSVAYTLPNCNLCGASLAGIPITFVDNVFMGFIHGIAKCAQFPLTISLRLETPSLMVFDDLLSLSSCHLNVIPTTCHISDWRFLLTRPKAALSLIQQMHSACSEVLKSQFLANSEWRNKILLGGAKDMTDDELISCVACGFNMPPSQYQLHLQYIMLPMLPYQHLMFLKGNHYTYGRFFPLEYVIAALTALIEKEKTMKITDDKPVEEIITELRDVYTVDYDKFHQACCERIGRDHDRLANWTMDGFEGFGIGNSVRLFSDCGEKELAEKDGKTVQAADKLALQNYGRPYKAGKPTGTFYSFAKTPKDIEIW